MTTIDKIGISGIRSFEPQNEVTLRFFKPLTIILGHNGAGKTTVIECIKMACAGDPPPFTDKGGAFIHDPKIASTTETKAKIRLQFTDVSNKKIIVNRQFQVTNKANRRQEFKTVEQSLQYTNEHGEKQTISHRCNDINKTVPELMGVSKAILENVIFVHQEESMWPLGDGKKLKEKFDDIFASTRYTKALESIRKQRKEHSIIVREKKGELILWKDRVERAEKLTSEYDKVKEEKQGLDDEVKSLEDQVSTVQADLNEIEEKLRGVKTIKERVQKMEAQKQAKEDAKQHVFSELEDELEDDDSELMNWINQANEKLESIKTSRATRQDQITETSKTIENLQEEHKLLTSQQGRLQAVELILADTKEEMANVKADLVSRGENVIEGNALADTDSDERWDKMLELKQRRAEAELENSMEENRKKLSANQAELNEVKLQTKQLETSMKDTQELLAHKRQTAFKLRESLRTSTSAEDPEEELVLEKERLRRATESLDALKQKGTSRMDSAHKENQRALHELRNRISSLHDERRTISQSEDTRARVEFLKEQLQEKTEAIKVKEAKILAYAKSVSQGTLSQESSALHEILATTIEDMDKGWRDLEASILEEKALMRATEFELNFMNTRVDELKKDAGLVNQRIQESAAQRTPRLTYDQIEDQLEKEKQLAEELLEEARMQRFGGEFIKSLIERGQETECCPTCTRSFESPIDLDALIKTLTKRMQRSLGEKLAEKERAAASQRSKCDNLATLIPLYKEKKVLDRRVEEEGKIRDDRAAALSKLAGSARAREIDVAFASSRAKEIDELKRLQQELGLLRKERERIEKDLEEERKKHGMSKFSRTISDIDEELIACHDQSDKLAKESEKLQQQREAHFAEISNGDKAVHDQKEKLRNLEYQVEDRKRVQTEVLELSSAAADLELKLKSLADQLAEVSEQEREAKKRVGDREDEFAKEEKLGREKLTSLRDLVSSFKKIKASIESYSTAEKDDELERLELRSDEVEKKIKELNTELKKLEGSDASDADKSLQFEQMMRNMNDNLRYRKIAKQVAEIESEIVKAWSDIEEIEEGRQVEEDHRKTLSVLNKLNSQRMSTEGKSLGFQHRLDALGEDIKSADLKGSHKAYNRIVIDVKTVELASADLEKYHRALDHALMTYHTMKMSEINKTVKELWQTTYQGNDIDYIEIASDADNADSGKLSSPAKRNYNYRVVMRRGDALLDMRGRCSAGQKVLACLIIRLALAESFAFDCGILALDEPTTNLDQRNIEKLSASLADIINNRRKQSNFQLILITHDEQFIELLGSREICDSYYLVYKDNDGFSRVKQQELISFA